MRYGAVIILGILGLCAGVLRAADVSTQSSAKPKVVIVQLTGEIDDYNRDMLERRFDQARKLGANVVIIDVDTYGGLVTSGEEISRFIKRQDDLHTIAYVKDKAISAGSMIAMACDEIVMSQSAQLGDCAPIIFNDAGDLQALPPAERAKQESTVLLDFAESAKRNHHDPVLAAAMVDVARSVYWIQDTHENRRFVDAPDYKQLKASGQWSDVANAPVPIDGPDTLLSVDGQQAVQYGLATEQAGSATELASRRGYDLQADLTSGWGENLVEILNSGVVRGLLLIVFLQCLYIVLHAPGHGVAESIGLIALGLMLGVPLLTGYAQWWEILMIFVGLLLVSFEILMPGHIVPGLSGSILFVIGLILTFIPKNPVGLPTLLEHPSLWWLMLEHGVVTVALAMIVSLALWSWIGRYLPKIPVFNRLIMPPPAAIAASSTTVSMPANAWPPIGAVGTARTELKPGGSAEFFDPVSADVRSTSVVSEVGFISPGTQIVVKSVQGPTILVRKQA